MNSYRLAFQRRRITYPPARVSYSLPHPFHDVPKCGFQAGKGLALAWVSASQCPISPQLVIDCGSTATTPDAPVISEAFNHPPTPTNRTPYSAFSHSNHIPTASRMTLAPI